MLSVCRAALKTSKKEVEEEERGGGGREDGKEGCRVRQ